MKLRANSTAFAGPPPDPNDRTGGDRLISYAERIIDRQINKARGILPFNSIVIAAFGFERGEIDEGLTVLNNVDVRFMLVLAMALLALSSLLCLGLMLVRLARLLAMRSFLPRFTAPFMSSGSVPLFLRSRLYARLSRS